MYALPHFMSNDRPLGLLFSIRTGTGRLSVFDYVVYVIGDRFSVVIVDTPLNSTNQRHSHDVSWLKVTYVL